MRPDNSRLVRGLALGIVPLLAFAACGSDGDSETGETGSEQQVPLIFGTTEQFSEIDPAASYDWPGSMLQINIAQTVLEVPPGGNQPEPEIAESCEFEDPKTYTCKLKTGLKFSDGSTLDSADVKFSMDRMIGIKHPEGPWSIWASSLESVEAPDPQTVIYHLKYADATWPMRLTYPGASIVPEGEYSATEIRKPSEGAIGSGPYKLTKFDPDQEIVLERNEYYKGDKEPIHDTVIIKPYPGSETGLKTAIEEGEIHVAHRTLNSTLIQDLEENGASKGVEVLQGEGTGISYVVFNQTKGPFVEKAVRQAFAYLIDREKIAQDVYNGTVEPLYTMVPSAFEGQYNAFQEVYGEKPDPAKAEQVLRDAGVSTPVKIQLWHDSGDHYGVESADMYQEIERQLESSGLFDVELKSAAWDRYSADYPTGAYQAFQLGWYPDFPDADNYLSPFFETNNFMEKGQGYSDKQMDQLLAEERSTVELEDRLPIFEQIQKKAAEDVPTLPIWEQKMVVAQRKGVKGVERTIDAANQIRLWLIDATQAQ
ncbi:MAG TPA: ABC transporter substrate-binding protein [Actinopolymorphaceae bacterium]|jgi:peptide/nickel transport system substrate-binding protein